MAIVGEALFWMYCVEPGGIAPDEIANEVHVGGLILPLELNSCPDVPGVPDCTIAVLIVIVETVAAVMVPDETLNTCVAVVGVAEF